jgi:rod shape-determining protein MreD
MKESLLFLPLTVIYLAIKSTLFPAFPAPDLPLIIVFYMAYRKSSFEAVLLGFALGYIEDAFSAGIIGSTSFALIAVFIAVNLFSRKVQFSTPMMRGGGIAVASAVKGLIIYAIIRASHAEASFLTTVILQAVVTGATSPAIILFLSRLAAWVSPQSFKDNEN